MRWFAFRLWPGGPGLIAAGVYPRRGWLTLLVWMFGAPRCLPIPLPVRAREGWR